MLHQITMLFVLMAASCCDRAGCSQLQCACLFACLPVLLSLFECVGACYYQQANNVFTDLIAICLLGPTRRMSTSTHCLLGAVWGCVGALTCRCDAVAGRHMPQAGCSK